MAHAELRQVALEIERLLDLAEFESGRETAAHD